MNGLEGAVASALSGTDDLENIGGAGTSLLDNEEAGWGNGVALEVCPFVKVAG